MCESCSLAGIYLVPTGFCSHLVQWLLAHPAADVSKGLSEIHRCKLAVGRGQSSFRDPFYRGPPSFRTRPIGSTRESNRPQRHTHSRPYGGVMTRRSRQGGEGGG
ncbi:hypothetical protein BO71DRAFT_144236 [Aspergillus ellipticus CBS 707.79]|uniref:Uncharacterized protein n=1 Tax=Aspergillus ellipticus CBS 707.79 TaxID=1448320 RepID=A0A319CSG7_9EURO|nr:hypothetical protein BO71DRAFT_144236 [Aspergillus ellipticus CBS 707.79]